jgi:hypothetical protein
VRLEVDGRLGVHRLADDGPDPCTGDLEPVGRQPSRQEVLAEGRAAQVADAHEQHPEPLHRENDRLVA